MPCARTRSLDDLSTQLHPQHAANHPADPAQPSDADAADGRDATGRLLVRMCVFVSVLIAVISAGGGVLFYLR